MIPVAVGMVDKESEMGDPNSHPAANFSSRGAPATEATRVSGVLLSLALLMAYVGSNDAAAQNAPGANEASPSPLVDKPPVAPEQQKTPVKKDVHHLAPTLGTEELLAKAVQARKAGLDFLVRTQNKDGSWGSHDPVIANLKDFGFSTSNPGSNDAVRLACTAICAQALMETPNRTPPQQAALNKAQEALLDTAKFAYHKNENFNIWGYCYKLDFLTSWLARDDSKPFRERIRAAAMVCINGAIRYQQHEGGWGYYASPNNDFDSMSFTTANFIIGLQRAKELGLPVKDGLIEDATEILSQMRVPDGSFVYSSGHRRRPTSMLAKLGSGSRTVVAALGLHAVGRLDQKDIKTSLDVFQEGENYLEDGRKLITPHTAAHQISGYFFFYGYNYATELATLLGEDYPVKRWDRLAWTMIRTQEDDGRWWDTPMANYGDKYATGFALLSLQRYLDAVGKVDQ